MTQPHDVSFSRTAARRSGAWFFATLALAWCAGTGAHPATERYIPIGYWESIGVTNTYLGPVVSVAPRAESMRFAEDGKEKTVRITEHTQIWIDRSHLKKKSQKGTRADVRAGVTAEVKLSATDPGTAEWIKIRGSR